MFKIFRDWLLESLRMMAAEEEERDFETLVRSVETVLDMRIFLLQSLLLRRCSTFLVETNEMQMNRPCSVFSIMKVYCSACGKETKRALDIL